MVKYVREQRYITGMMYYNPHAALSHERRVICCCIVVDYYSLQWI